MEKAEEMIKAVKKNYEYGDKKKGAILDQMLKMPGMIKRITDLHEVMNENPATWKTSGEEVLPTEYTESIIYDTIDYYQKDEYKDDYNNLKDALTSWFDRLVESDELEWLDFEDEDF